MSVILIAFGALMAACLSIILVIFYRQKNKVQDSYQTLQSILDTLPTAVHIVGVDDFCVKYANKKMMDVVRCKSFEDVTGRNILEFMPGTQPDGRNSLEMAIEIHKHDTSVEEVQAYKMTGELFFARVTSRQIIFEGKKAILSTLEDMTAEKENKLQLLKLNLAMNAAKISLWDMQVVTHDPVNPVNKISWSDDFRRLLGYENESDFPNLISSFHSRLHPEDLEWIPKAISAHMLDTTAQTPFDVEFRVLKKNGELAYLHATGETIRDKNGNPLHVAGTIIDVTKIKNLISEAERQRIEAEKANLAKSVFLSHMSHEIRTPLNAVLGAAEIQLQKDNLSYETEEAFVTIYTSASLLLNIINNILDISKIEANKMDFVPVKYNIPSLLYESMQMNILQNTEKSIEFNIIIDENTPLDIIGDEMRVKQILNNILSNAFKYTEKGNIELTVSAECKDSDCILVLRVSDTGQGMTQEQIKVLFDEYTRFNMEVNRSTTGSGLGMSITKRLIDLMKGEIFVESEPGNGSVFTVKLPQERVGSSVCGPDLASQLSSNRFQSTTGKTDIRHDYMPYGNILIVDDIEANIYVAKGMLEPYGLKIETAENGFDAISKIVDGGEYDMIFMDHMMPKMDGAETTEIIRGMGYKRPIIALTANAVAGSEEMFMSNGFNGFISKPIDTRELDAIIHRFIRNIQPVTAPKLVINDRLSAAVVRSIENAIAVLKGTNTDTRLYITTVHGMRGALANLGETGLSDTALILEQAAEKGNTDEVLSKTPEFINSLEIIVEKFKPKRTKNSLKISDEEITVLQNKLNKIKAACEDFDTETATKELDEISSGKWSSYINEFLNEISVNLLRGDLKKAISFLSELILKIGD